MHNSHFHPMVFPERHQVLEIHIFRTSATDVGQVKAHSTTIMAIKWIIFLVVNRFSILKRILMRRSFYPVCNKFIRVIRLCRRPCERTFHVWWLITWTFQKNSGLPHSNQEKIPYSLLYSQPFPVAFDSVNCNNIFLIP